MTHKFRYLIVNSPVHGLLILSFFLLAACSKQAEEKNQGPAQVTVAKPLVKMIIDWNEFSGRLAAVESVDVRARVSGYLESVNFQEGTIVNKGDLLYVIDPRPYQATLDAASAAVAIAEASLQLAENDLRRVERLILSKTVSEEELDSRTQQRRKAAASLELAKASLRSAKLDIEFTHIYSPILGRIGKTQVTPGNLVTGGEMGANLLTTIVSLDPIHFYIAADEQDYMKYLRMAQTGERPSSRNTRNPVRLKLADEAGFIHEGYMDFVDNRIDDATGTMMGRAVFPNPDLFLVPGMFAELQLIGGGPYKSLQIPDSAIGFDQSQQFVLVVDKDKVIQRRLVKPGRLLEGLRVIGEGLSADDLVVIDGLQRVRPGQTVDATIGSIASEVDKTVGPR